MKDPPGYGASAIVKADYPDVWIAQIGDDEAHSGKQFSLVPLHLRDHSPSNVPALGLVDEVMIGDDGLRGKPLRRPY